MRLDVLAHVGDRALRGDAEHLRQDERRDRLHDRRAAGDQRERHQQLCLLLADDVVDQILGRRRQDEAGEPVDEHQDQAERQPAAARQISARASSHAPA